MGKQAMLVVGLHLLVPGLVALCAWQISGSGWWGLLCGIIAMSVQVIVLGEQ